MGYGLRRRRPQVRLAGRRVDQPRCLGRRKDVRGGDRGRRIVGCGKRLCARWRLRSGRHVPRGRGDLFRGGRHLVSRHDAARHERHIVRNGLGLPRRDMCRVRGRHGVRPEQAVSARRDRLHDGCRNMHRVRQSAQRRRVRQRHGLPSRSLRRLHERPIVRAGESVSRGHARLFDGNTNVHRQGDEPAAGHDVRPGHGLHLRRRLRGVR